MDFSKLSDFGNFVFTGLTGTKLSDRDKNILETIRPAGILFLKRNILQDVPYDKWQSEFSELISDIRKYSGRDKILLSIDHEGGKVQRTPEPITNFGYPRDYSKQAGAIARAMAEELKSIGINLSWAPSADINTNPENPIVGKLGRAFSTDAKEVASAAVEFAKGLMEKNIISCAKHFPGHGGTWSDSHLELPVVDSDEQLVRSRELLPFQALIDAGVPMVMTAHVLFNKIDPKNPATFSKKILSDILRKEMGFKGVIIADDINMLAIFDRIRTVEGIAETINAGIDTYIVGRFPEPEKDDSPLLVCKLLKQALEEGKISAERLQESKLRVDALLEHTTMFDPHILDSAFFAKHVALKSSILV